MTRKRLTITLRNDLVKLLDEMADGQTIRNRSHAVEVVLAQSLVPKATKVLILAGGRGTNFRPFTYEIPKAMIPVGGKPLLEHTIEQLKKFNLTDVTISIGHLGEKIQGYFGDGSKWGLSISYLVQRGSKIGTSPAMRGAKGVFASDTFLLMYADVLADIDLLDLIAFHRAERQAVVTMALASVERATMWGVAKLSGSAIVAFEEKPDEPHSRSHLINAGIYVMEPSIFTYIGKDSLRLESDVFPKLAVEKKLLGYPFAGAWYDVSTPHVYEEVIREWQS